MEIVFYCGDCNKFFYTVATEEQFSSVCPHCGSETTITCQMSKEAYADLPADRKDPWKASIRRLYPSKNAIVERRLQLKSNQHHKKALNVLFTLKGNRGRTLTICKNKCIIKTDVTVGSVVTGNATDGEKIIFFKHCAGLQFKESGLAIGYLQFETPSMQMNNQNSNFFSENTFTFEEKNGITNALMREVFYYTMELIEGCSSNTDFQVPEYPPLLGNYLSSAQ